jgi:hypothetical protein
LRDEDPSLFVTESAADMLISRAQMTSPLPGGHAVEDVTESYICLGESGHPRAENLPY